MKCLQKNVQLVWASLREAIGSMPCGAIYLAITKASTKATVESFEGADNREGDANLGQESKNRPPGQGVKTLFNVETRQPKRGSTAALQVNDVRQELTSLEGP